MVFLLKITNSRNMMMAIINETIIPANRLKVKAAVSDIIAK